MSSREGRETERQRQRESAREKESERERDSKRGGSRKEVEGWEKRKSQPKPKDTSSLSCLEPDTFVSK
jgi:hypothetical protein